MKFKQSLKIVFYYMTISFLWITFSDKILYVTVKDLKLYNLFQTYKGLFFVLFTSALLFKLIQNSYSKFEVLEKKLKTALVELESRQAELENKQKELKKLAYVDHLTGLATRRVLDEKYELLFESAKRSKGTITFIMIDIDYFKKYNDRYGHQKGDSVLKEIGKVSKEVFKREGDLISRYGGEEFAVVLYQTPLEDIILLIEKFQSKLEDCDIEHKDSPFGNITVSIGINSGKVTQDENSQTFLRKADVALYKAKQNGRNKYCV